MSHDQSLYMNGVTKEALTAAVAAVDTNPRYDVSDHSWAMAEVYERPDFLPAYPLQLLVTASKWTVELADQFEADVREMIAPAHPNARFLRSDELDDYEQSAEYRSSLPD